ncbi:glycosyltransferase [Candidatus Bathyarchaeota archaeon]|nr:glycosyltransferase [Candidatus Bathyarchaeota archaeon]
MVRVVSKYGVSHLSLLAPAGILSWLLLKHIPQGFDATSLVMVYLWRVAGGVYVDLHGLVQVWFGRFWFEVLQVKMSSQTCFGDVKDLKNLFWNGLMLIFFGSCKVSVVVPTLNEEKYLGGCLRSLQRQDFDGEFEVIVVDGGSVDSTVDVARGMADRVLVCEGKPVGDSRNIGARFAQADKVAFIDADTVASGGWVRSLWEALSVPGVVGATGPTLPYRGSGLDYAVYSFTVNRLQRLSISLGVPHIAGFNCAYRKEALLKCGGFGEGRTLSEDLALSLKIRCEGRLVYDEGMVAYTSLRRIRRYGYVRLGVFYLLNDLAFTLTGRSLHYPPVR